MLYIFTYTNTDTHSNAHTHINFIRITIGVQIKEWSVHLTTTFLWIGIKEFKWWNHISTVDNLSSFDISQNGNEYYHVIDFIQENFQEKLTKQVSLQEMGVIITIIHVYRPYMSIRM